MESLMGFFLARVGLFGIYPVGLAFYGAVFSEGNGRFFTALGVFLGMVTVAEPIDCMKAVVLMGSLAVFQKLLAERKLRLDNRVIAWLMASCAVGVSATKLFLFPARNFPKLLLPLEFVVILCLVRIFYEGVSYIMHAKRGQALDNPQLISIVFLFLGSIYGLPDVAVAGMSLPRAAVYFCLLMLAYIYGVGAGALVGCGAGIMFALWNQDVELLGIICLLGIIPGLFREMGKSASAIAFAVGNVALGMLFSSDAIGIECYKEMVASVGLFMVLPRQVTAKAELAGHGVHAAPYLDAGMGKLIRDKMQELSRGFEVLARSFTQVSAGKGDLDRTDMLDIFDDLSGRLCRDCENQKMCWKQHYYDTYRSAFSLLDVANHQGIVLKEDISPEFMERCIRFDDFLREVNFSLSLARNALGWRNRMADARLAVAGQMGEVSVIMQDFARELMETEPVQEENTEYMALQLKKQGIQVQDISVLERRHHRKEVYVTARGKKRACITTRGAAGIIGQVLGRKMKPDDAMRSVIGQEYEVWHFVEDTKYKAATGVAKIKKDGESISGDHFSILQLASGHLLMVLSDGMGSGEIACRESQTVIELIEQMMEAGFSAETSLHMINSMMVLEQENEENASFTTVDISSVDLYTGNCQFVKNGASATYVRHGGEVEEIRGQSLPVGVLTEAVCDTNARVLVHGDYVVMATDGVLDSLAVYSQKTMEELIQENGKQGPQELAEYILQTALQDAGYAMDDMMVLTAAIWKR